MESTDFNSLINVAVFALIGGALIFVSIYLSDKKKRILKNGVDAEGIIFDIESSGSRHIRAQYPVVRFLTSENVWITERYDIAVTPFPFKKGERVDVVYNPEDPREFILKSGKLSAFESASLMILIAGIGCLLIAIYKLMEFFKYL